MRQLRVAYWDHAPRQVNFIKGQLERHLRDLTEISLFDVQGYEQAVQERADLVVVAADHLDAEIFATWFPNLQGKIAKTQGIWVPALILTKLDFAAVHEQFAVAYRDNWYCDLIHPDHLSSLPIRVANLIKMHDHLREMERYQSALSSLEQRVDKLNAELTAFRTLDPKS